MKKYFIGSLLLGICIIILFISQSYYHYRDYYMTNKKSLFFYIPTFLGTYYLEKSEENESYNKDEFYLFMNSYYSDSLFIASFPTGNFLNHQKEDIRFCFNADSNYFVLYDIGIDRKDDSLKKKVFEELPFLYPVLRPKGDILLGYIMPHAWCDNENSLNWYFKNSQRVAVNTMDSIIRDSVYPDVVSLIQNDTVVTDSVFLLFRLRHLESDDIWQSKLLCNWTQTNPKMTGQISDKIIEMLVVNKFHLNADSIIYHFKYPNFKPNI